MRRAIPLLLFALCAAFLVPHRPQAASRPSSAASTIDASGLVDYTRKPDLKVGTWVQYHVTGSSLLGKTTDYVVTALVGGEERFWGDDCFWIETWTEPKGKRTHYVASLMSYAIYQDSLSHQYLKEYGRKVVTRTDDEGNPLQEITLQSPGGIKARRKGGPTADFHTDSLGVDTVMVPLGTFRCQKIRIRQGVRQTVESGESTLVNETEEHRTRYKTLDVPITSIVREDIEKWVRKRAWKAGKSENVPTVILEHATGSSRLIDFGTGLTPKMVPVQFRKSIREQHPPRGSTSAARVTGRKTR